MADNYQNYIYLFNNENKLKQKGKLLQTYVGDWILQNWSTAVSHDDQYFVNTEAITKLMGASYDAAYKTKATTTTELEDYPTAKTAEEGQHSKFVGMVNDTTPFRTGPAGAAVGNTATNDPGQNPFYTHMFEVEASDNGVPTKKYKFDPKVRTNSAYYKFFFFPGDSSKHKTPTLPNKLVLNTYFPSKEYYSNNNLGKPNDKRDLIQDKDNPFLFYQDTVRRSDDWKTYGGTRAAYALEVDSLFKEYYKKTAGSIENNFFVSYSTFDTNTKIGVPYDFQTLLLEGINDSANGVDSKQPSYDKLYNYYDAQYEPTMIAAVESNIIDEKGLPCIYDFLYLDQQPNLRPYVKINGMSLEESNLASINQWLDNYAKMYSDYMQSDKAPVYLKDVINILDISTSKWATDYNITLEDLGWVNPNIPSDIDTAINSKYQLTLKKLGLSAIGTLDPDAIDIEKAAGNPAWLYEIKTGVYFSEKQLDTFTQTLDKDTVFPHVLKVNIPIEAVGPIAKLLSQYNLLDNLNSYAASTTIPNENNISAYQKFYGCVINGIDNKNFNNLYDLKLPSFKIYFKTPPNPPTTIQEAYDLGTALYPDHPSNTAGGNAGFNSANVSDDVNVNNNQGTGDGTDSTVGTGAQTIDDLSKSDIYYSWLKKHINAFVNIQFFDYKYPPGHKILFKATPMGLNKAPLPEFPARIQIWSYCEGGVVVGGPGAGTALQCKDNFIDPPDVVTGDTTDIKHPIWNRDWTEKAYEEEKIAIAETAINEEDGFVTPYVLEDVSPSDVLDLTGKDITPESIFSKKTQINDLYIDDLTAGIAPEVLVYGVNKNVTSNNAIEGLLEKLKTISLKKKLSKLFVEGKLMRTPNDIHNGKLAHQETLMYEIAKYSISDGNKEKYIQSIFLPITEKSQLSYYDTQVLPFKDYFYKIFAHKAIVGTEYKAIPYPEITGDMGTMAIKPYLPPPDYKKDDSGNNISKFFIGINYKIEPYIEVVRVPYYNVSAVNVAVDKLNYSRIEDYPPLAPQVNFVPFKGVNNKVLIMMNNSIGQIEQYPRVLYEYEKKQVSDLALAQDRIPGDKLIYKSDDSQGTFSCFRVNNLFHSYERLSKDKSMRLRELESNSIEKNDSYVDYIMPNQTYYYVFRFTDIHNKMSNPTDIYKVRMEQPTVGSSYLTVDILDIKDIQKKNHDSKFSTVREMQKYLYIQPSFTQNTVTAEPDIEKKFFKKTKVSLGDPAGVSVFGKKFKIRISSKQTGKKIDINLTVKDPEIIINE